MRFVALVGVSVVLTTVVTVIGLLVLLDAPQVEIQLDIIKTGLAAGAGPLVTLLYTARGHLLAEEVARDSRLDASETRIVELYANGIERFGADPVQVRVGGLYALERLARGTPDLREQVIDVAFSQLRTRGRRVHLRRIGRASSTAGPVEGSSWTTSPTSPDT